MTSLQAMGYLHEKGIVHKELKSKNIHIERASIDYAGKDSRPPKAYVADYGLFDLYRFCEPSPGYRFRACCAIASHSCCL